MKLVLLITPDYYGGFLGLVFIAIFFHDNKLGSAKVRREK